MNLHVPVQEPIVETQGQNAGKLTPYGIKNWQTLGSTAVSGITQLTGDVTTPAGGGIEPATLATVNANVGTFGDSTHVAQVTVNGKGLVTAAANVAITATGTVTTTGTPASGNLTKFSGATSITNGNLSGDVSTSGTLVTALSTTGVSPSTYGDSTHVGQFTVDAKGRITAATPVAIAGGTGASAVPILVASNTTVSSGTGMVIPEQLEVAAGVTFEVEGGARVEVTGRVVSGSVLLFDSTLTVAAPTLDTGVAGIPTGYNVLEIWIIARTDEALVSSSLDLTFNGDTGANYDRISLSGVNTTPASGVATAATSVGLGVAGSSDSSGVPTVFRMTIPGYAQTYFNKTGEYSGIRPDNTAANRRVEIAGFQWRSTAAITRLTLTVDTAGNKLVPGSRLLIYGR